MGFTNIKIKKDFEKLSSDVQEMIKIKFKKEIAFLTTPDKKVRKNKGEVYRVKCKKYRIFYKIENLKVIIFKISEKDKDAYKGVRSAK